MAFAHRHTLVKHVKREHAATAATSSRGDTQENVGGLTTGANQREDSDEATAGTPELELSTDRSSELVGKQPPEESTTSAVLAAANTAQMSTLSPQGNEGQGEAATQCSESR